MQRRVAERGFTLIEVLLVVAIIGLLSSIAIPSLRGAVRDGQRAALIADARALHLALQSYQTDNSQYPTSLNMVTYAPLSDLGYFEGGPALNAKLDGGKPQFYMVTPSGSQYITFLRLDADPTVTVAVVSTDLLPGVCIDPYCDGIYLLSAAGTLVPVDEGD